MNFTGSMHNNYPSSKAGALSRTLLRGVTTLVALSLVGSGLSASASETTPEKSDGDAKSSKVASRPDRVSAMSTAQAQKSRVEDISARTESSSSFANPDGSWTTETFSGPIRIRNKNGEFVPVDTDLVRNDGKYTARTGTGDVTLSDGGDKTVGTVRSDKDKSVGVKIDKNLPAPTVKDSTATYPSAVDGHDLVIKSFPNGFNFSVNVDERPAADADPLEFAFPLELDGLQATMAENGSMLFKSDKKVVASSSAPVMWDSSKDDDKAAMPVDAELVDGALVLRPSMEFLTDPETVFPVTVDPSIVLNVTTDTWVDSLLNTSSQVASPELQVGSNSLGLAKARSYVYFYVPTPPAGTVATAATVNLTNFGTGSCTGTALTMRQITGSWTPGAITWSTQPTTAASGTSSSQSFGASACPAEGIVTFDATAVVNSWFGGAENLGVQIKADNESAASGFRRFHSLENGDLGKIAKLSITYSIPPSTPTGSTVIPAVSDGTTLITPQPRPTFTASVSDPDGGLVTPTIKLTKGASTIHESALTPVTSGSLASFKPPADLTDGTYVARWKASDASSSSSWSDPIEVVVDTTAPAPPTIACTGLTNSTWYDPRPASTTSCTVTASTGTQDVTGDLNGVVVTFPQLSSGTTSKTFDLPNDGVFDLKASGRDAVGNTSAKASLIAGLGTGALTSPTPDTRSTGSFTIDATSKAGATTAQVQWRATGTTTWTAATQVKNGLLPWSGLPVTSGYKSTSGQLTWNAAAETGMTNPSLVEVRFCFNYSGTPSQRCTAATQVSLLEHAYGDSFPTSNVGPASVALMTGEFQMTEDDVDVPGYADNLTLSRTYQSYGAPTSPAQGVFGPGWIANFGGPGDSSAASQVIDKTSTDGTIVLVDPDGTSSTYKFKTGGHVTQAVGIYVGQGKATSLNQRLEIKTGSPKTLELTESSGTKTTWNYAGSNKWTVKSVGNASPIPATTYAYSGDFLTGIYAGVPGITCTAATQNKGCHALLMTYANVSGAQRLTEVGYRTWDPKPGTDGLPGAGAAMTTIPVMKYEYDASGKLIQAWDPRMDAGSAHVAAAYTYQSVGGKTYMDTLTPAGEKPWAFHLNFDGSLDTVTRQQDPAVGGTATWSVVYDVPLSGTGLPDLSSTTTATWGQPEAPDTATAVFGPDAPGTTDMTYATITYFTNGGHTTNAATYGAGDWLIDSFGWDEHGNQYWHLDPANHATVVDNQWGPGGSWVLGEHTTFDSKGERPEYTLDPTRTVTLENGNIVSGRLRTNYTYNDEGVSPGQPTPSSDPDDPRLNIVIKKTTDVTDNTPPSGTVYGTVSNTEFRYDKVVSTDGNGWAFQLPTRVRTEIDGQFVTQQLARYDTEGKVIETRTAHGVSTADGAGSDANSTIAHYYTADGSSPIAACQNHPEWLGEVCTSGPAGGTNFVPTTTVAAYDYFLNPTRTHETSLEMSRTSVRTFDAAARPTKQTLTVVDGPTTDQPVPDSTITYSSTTGRVATVSNGTAAVSVTFDTWGRQITQSDGIGNTQTLTYDGADRVRTLDDGKGVYTYTYDGTDAHGKTERRGLITKLDVGLTSGPDEFTAGYDKRGNRTRVVHPNGLVADSTFNEIGQQLTLKYAKSGVTAMAFSKSLDALGRSRVATTPLSIDNYQYDDLGRLRTVQDAVAGQCTTRAYTFNPDHSRTKLETAGPGTSGVCTTASPTTKSSTFHSDDKLADTGYSYDRFGRTRVIPSADTDQVGGGQALVSYFANDTVARIRQEIPSGGPLVDKRYTLDPLNRISGASERVAGIELSNSTNHYAVDGDSPAWIEEQTRTSGSAPWATTWTRNVEGIDGGLAILQSSDGTSRVQLTNLHGDIVSTMPNTAGAGPALENYSESDEYGNPKQPAAALDQHYTWLGGYQRSDDTVSGLTLMGQRLYNPRTGLFLSRDPIPGGSANAYTYPVDPINTNDLDGTRPECGGCGGDRNSPVAYKYNYNGTSNNRKPGNRSYHAPKKSAGQVFTAAKKKQAAKKKAKSSQSYGRFGATKIVLPAKDEKSTGDRVGKGLVGVLEVLDGLAAIGTGITIAVGGCTLGAVLGCVVSVPVGGATIVAGGFSVYIGAKGVWESIFD